MKVYEIITDLILTKLDQGVVPWRKTWACSRAPQSLITGKPYRGLNVFLLNMQGYASPFWLSFKQTKERKAVVKKDEKATPVIYWNWQKRKFTRPNGDIDEQEFTFLRYYNVFNVAQVDGLTLPEDFDARITAPIISCDEIISQMPQAPAVKHGFARAAFNWGEDSIKMPPRESFNSDASYYQALFHELVHATGHSSRLGRKGAEEYERNSEPYCKEELVAEIGASFLCQYTGIGADTIDNSASYIEMWRKKLSDDKRLIISAAAQAQKAVDFILNRKVAMDKAA